MRKLDSLTFLAALFIIIGILLTLENYSIINGVLNQWPILILIFGIGFLFLFFKSKKELFVVWLSYFLILNSIFFYYLNLTSWKKLSTLWPFFLGIIGLSFLAVAISSKKRIFTILSILFIVLFIALYLVFTISLKLWPLSLVVFGLSLLIIEIFNKK